MRLSAYFLIIFLFPLTSNAENNLAKKDSFPNYGTENKSSTFFRERFLHTDLAYYLDNLNDFVTYQSETTGSYNLPDHYIFSISGNSFKWNKYYLDGFRIDSRFSPGSVAYHPDLSTHALNIDYYNSSLRFSTDSTIPNSLAFTYNIGGLGGVSPSTKSFINLFHKSASERIYKPERLYNPIDYRNKMRAAGSFYLNYSIPIGDKQYSQQIYADFGTRMIANFDESGINSYDPENFMKLQLSGQLPIKASKFFDKTNYLCNISERQNLYSEFNFGNEETAQNNAYSLSIYGLKNKSNYNYTSGITLATNKVRHNDLNFSRNLIDQDGEAFEPWYPDGTNTELSHALNYTQNLTSTLQLTFDSYNSAIHFSPSTNTFQNPIFARKENVTPAMIIPFQSLYIYEWKSNAFTSGLLENTLGLKTHNKISNNLNFKANFDLTFDGMIIASKSMLRPNWQAQMGLYYHPSKWFSLEVNMSRNRVAFNFDDTRYFSNDYLNANVYFWKDTNADQQYQTTEKLDYFTSTGGMYHKAVKKLKQQSYFVLDIPFYFRFGNHEFSILNTYKKYNNNWTTRFDKNADQYGFFKNEDIEEYYPEKKGDKQIYFYNGGAVNYLVDYYPEEYMKTNQLFNFATNTPYYAASTMKYQYNSEKFLFSVSWCSYIMCGISTLGNGPLHNNIGVYSETSANPNINYKLVGRNDQDRAYVAHILMSYKVNKNLSFALSGKFKDGQPFTSYDTQFAIDAKGNTQLAIWNNRTKGINPMNGDFGSRKDAFFNIDFRTTFSGRILNRDYEIQMMMYNIYDYGTELTEYTFEPDNENGRFAMELSIPRGLMITAKVYF